MMTFDEFGSHYEDIITFGINQKDKHIRICGAITDNGIPVFELRLPRDYSDQWQCFELSLLEPKIIATDSDTKITKEELEELMDLLTNESWNRIIKGYKVEYTNYPWCTPIDTDKIPSTPPNYMELLNNQ